jgi:hypothetical protein
MHDALAPALAPIPVRRGCAFGCRKEAPSCKVIEKQNEHSKKALKLRAQQGCEGIFKNFLEI